MSSASKKVIWAALVGNSLIAITKFFAALLTGSSAMLSEGIHSLVDTGNQVLLLYGLKRSEAPPDEYFPFGHGKEIYFWSFVVAILIFAVGAGISLYEGIVHISHPSKLTNPNINYIVLGLAFLFEGAAWLFAFREFSRAKGKWGIIEAVQRGKNPSLFVVLFEDSAAMLGLIVAFMGIYISHRTHNPLYDGLASIVIGIILGGTAVWLAYETKGLLIGESANREIVHGIRILAGSYPQIQSVNEVLTLHMGPDFILTNISLDFVDTVPAGQVEDVLEQIRIAIKEEYPQVKRVFAEPRKAVNREP
ncbi:MAG: cation diffusion facilitator family transporter [bacterium]|nr:cation diffusion facilitator family transporter [bacterium]MDT8365866.1 cation diffusion facilitator family transporter [bacterium]